MLYSCLDTIQNTEKALDSFLTQKSGGASDYGCRYKKIG